MDIECKSSNQGGFVEERGEIGIAVAATSLSPGLLIAPERWHGVTLAVIDCVVLSSLLVRLRQQKLRRLRSVLRRLVAHRRGRFFVSQVERWLRSSKI